MEVMNGQTVLEFDGQRIGFGTSKGASYDPLLWHEVEIFKLNDGKYVVHKIGRSEYEHHTDRHSAHICDDAHAAVRALYGRDKQGIWKMTITAEDAAEEASHRDEDFASAFRRQRISA